MANNSDKAKWAQLTPEERASRANDRSRRYEMNLKPAIAHEIREAEQVAYEDAAEIIDAEARRVLSKQEGDFYDSINTNLRMIAVVLSDIAAALRKRGSRDE